jgi:hypothetical protein
MSGKDDKQLTDLFRAAADDAGTAAPPPTFGHDDVLKGSHRLARRQRATVAALVAGVVLIGVGTVFSGVLRGPSQTSALAERPPAASVTDQSSDTAANAPAEGTAPGDPASGAGAGVAPPMPPEMAPAPYAAKSAPRTEALNSAPGAEPRFLAPGAAPNAPGAAPNAPGAAPNAPGAAPNAAAGGAPFAADSAGPSARSKVLAEPGGCTALDARIYTQLTLILPAARTSKPYAVPGGCAPGGTGVALDAADGTVPGTLVAVLTPAAGNPAIPPDSGSRASATAHTPTGGVLRLTAVAAQPGPIPHRARLAELAAALAAHL